MEPIPMPNKKRQRSKSPSPTLESPTSPDSRPICTYGQNCYRRNPTHLKEFQHPILESLFKTLTTSYSFSSQDFQLSKIPKDLQAGFDDMTVVLQQLKILKGGNFPFLKCDQVVTTKKCRAEETGAAAPAPEPQPTQNKDCSTSKFSMSHKWTNSCPYNYFLTRIPGEKNDVPYSVSFLEIFDKSFGDIKQICHFNFMVEADWFIDQMIQGKLESIPTTIIYGVETPELSQASKVFPNLRIHLAKSPFPFGHHHTKMILIEHADETIRFVVMTANLIESDWRNRTQGVWMSPKCPTKTNNPVSLDSPTKFRSDLVQYLSTYPSGFLSNWIPLIKTADCSEIKVVFIGSAPHTSQSPTNGFQWGIMKMDTIMKHGQSSEIDPSWPLIMQCSSIATLGPSEDWLRGELGSSMLGKSWAPQTPIRVIYPTNSNVCSSIDGIHGGGCLPYNKSTHSKQTWIQRLLFQWKSSLRNRTPIMPHIKTYCRVSPDNKNLGWFLSTSANLSKAAWGKLNKNHDRLTIMSWESGVLFLPTYFGLTSPFQISQTSAAVKNEFMIPYDLPLQKYESNDQPWFIDNLLELQP